MKNIQPHSCTLKINLLEKNNKTWEIRGGIIYFYKALELQKWRDGLVFSRTYKMSIERVYEGKLSEFFYSVCARKKTHLRRMTGDCLPFGQNWRYIKLCWTQGISVYQRLANSTQAPEEAPEQMSLTNWDIFLSRHLTKINLGTSAHKFNTLDLVITTG